MRLKTGFARDAMDQVFLRQDQRVEPPLGSRRVAERNPRYMASNDPDLKRAHKTKLVAAFLDAHTNLALHSTPTYSSCLNQVELWFSKAQRDVISRGVFTSTADLARKLCRYINADSKDAKPIRWKYSNPSRRIRHNNTSSQTVR